jgi:hypothetical protein
MNQCSTVFFDRTKLADARPQVLDIFANAIANVVSMTIELPFSDTDSCPVGNEDRCIRKFLAASRQDASE